MDVIDKDIKADNEQQLKYSFLKDCLFDSYNKELERRDRLESKAIGFYIVVGIFFASFLVVEPLLIIDLPLSCIFNSIPAFINCFLVVFGLFHFSKAFYYLFKTYSVQRREEVDILEKWEEILNKSFDDTIESLRNAYCEKIENLCSNNNQKVKNLEKIIKCCIIICISIIFLFILLVIQKSFL